MFSMFSNLPRPVQALSMLVGGAGLFSTIMAVANPDNPIFKWIAISIIAVIVVLLLFKGVLILIDKSKSGPFASLLTKAGGRASADPAQKARMDDMRKKFEEGLKTFKSAGKDVYSLPWFILVGPSGSGKTEAMRHCNVGFPPGLQDHLQGSGGTLNMHWWFTNHAVVLDTAGRMFMEESTDGGSTEWKELLKSLKAARPNAPINGMLLVISSESLLKDSAEKIEATAGAIARQLDVVQRTLDVRFPVFVVITKCDKIVGFRDFFETINSPDLQHQILGWSNPASLDEAFKPDQVDKHLESVRQKLLKRRFGLLQNPVHTADPNLRRTDQVDELFELPDNLVRIAPRLRRYLEMIFVAGEWSPKPLFLRGIYFTSSMREGQALDMTLASALGVDVESIPGGREWDKEKAYFLRDVFLSKVFKEKGLVTRANNVNKQLAKQRTVLIVGSLAATIVAGALGAFAYFGFKGSIGGPSKFWGGVQSVVVGEGATEGGRADIRFVQPGGGKYFGDDKIPDLADALAMESAETRLDLVKATTEQAEATGKISVPPPASWFPGLFGLDKGLSENSRRAQRVVVDMAILAPGFDAVRDKLKAENEWSPASVAALAQLVRLQTFAYGQTPSVDGGGLLGDATKALKDPKSVDKVLTKRESGAIDADALYVYVLDEKSRPMYEKDSKRIIEALKAAYPKGLSGVELPSTFQAKDERSANVITDAVAKMSDQLTKLALPGSDMDKVQAMINALDKFQQAERQLQDIRWLAKGGAAAPEAPRSIEEYKDFSRSAMESLDALDAAKREIDAAAAALGNSAGEPGSLLSQAEQDVNGRVTSYFEQLKAQVPAAGGGLLDLAKDAAGKKDAKAAGALAALGGDGDAVSQLRAMLEAKQPEVEAKVKEQLAQLSAKLKVVSPLMLAGKISGGEELRAYAVRAASYEAARQELKNADADPAALSADEVVSRLKESLAGVDSASAAAKQKVDQGDAWSLLKPSDAKPALDEARNAASRVSKRAIDIAGMRRRFLVVDQTIVAWPKDKNALEAKAAALTQARLKAGVFTEEPRRSVPLSSIPANERHKDEFYAQTGKEILGAFAELRAVVEGDSSGQARILSAGTGPGTLGSRTEYRGAASATSDYAKDYLGYWRGEAIEQVRPTAPSWDAWRDGLRVVTSERDINGPLVSVRKDATEALGVVPKNLGVDPLAALDEVKKAYAGLDDVGFKDRTSSTLIAWKELVSRKADEARTSVLRSYRNNSITRDYLHAFGSLDRGGVAYWNEFYTKGMDLLVQSTTGDLLNARNVLQGAKAVPLAFVPADGKELTPQELMSAIDASNKLLSIPKNGAAASGGGADVTDAKLTSLLSELDGASILGRDDLTVEWLRRMRLVLDVFAPGKTVKITQVQLAPSESYSGLDGIKAIDKQWGAIVVDGNKLGETFNIGSGLIIPATSKQLTFEYPRDYGKSVWVGLYSEDPGNDKAKLNQPQAKLELSGGWGLVGAGLRSVTHTQVRPDGTWRVPVVSNGYSLVLDVTFDSPLPKKEDWPDGRSWPK